MEGVRPEPSGQTGDWMASQSSATSPTRRDVHTCARPRPGTLFRSTMPLLKGDERMIRSLLRAAHVLLLALAVGGVATAAFAGTTGKLAGSVTDEKHQPLPGVTIRIEGQRLGAISDE